VEEMSGRERRNILALLDVRKVGSGKIGLDLQSCFSCFKVILYIFK
jgi:hypothetical protein